jgi:hypothetical protein
VKKESRGEDGEGWTSLSAEEHDAPIENVGGDSQLSVKKEKRGEDGEGWNLWSDEENLKKTALAKANNEQHLIYHCKTTFRRST